MVVFAFHIFLFFAYFHSFLQLIFQRSLFIDLFLKYILSIYYGSHTVLARQYACIDD
jgi:hypothetical protein